MGDLFQLPGRLWYKHTQRGRRMPVPFRCASSAIPYWRMKGSKYRNSVEGELEVNEAAFVDHDENGPVDIEENQASFPEEFTWTCCRRQADDPGCVRDQHQASVLRKRRRLWSLSGGLPKSGNVKMLFLAQPSFVQSRLMSLYKKVSFVHCSAVLSDNCKSIESPSVSRAVPFTLSAW